MDIEAVIVGVAAPADIRYAEQTLSFAGLEGIEADVAAYAHLVTVRAALAGAGSRVVARVDPGTTTVLEVKRALLDAAGRCRPGDLFVVVLCGHGFQRPDDDVVREPDGLDEVFACSNGPLVDDFFPVLWKAVDPGAAALVIVDACSADTIGLAVQWPDREDIRVPPPSCTWSSGPPRIAFAACPSWDVAREAVVNGGPRGTFSAHLESALAEAPASYAAWYATTVQTMGQEGVLQVPRLRYVGPRRQVTMLEASPFTTAAHT